MCGVLEFEYEGVHSKNPAPREHGLVYAKFGQYIDEYMHLSSNGSLHYMRFLPKIAVFCRKLKWRDVCGVLEFEYEGVHCKNPVPREPG